MLQPDELRDRLDQALANESGVEIDFMTRAEANRFRMALYALRRAEARQNAATYPPDHTLHARSVYDSLLIRIEDESRVIIEHHKPVPPAKPRPDQASK